MDKKLQDEFREALMKKYLQAAWEALANYAYYGQQYTHIEKQIDNFEKIIEDAETRIKEIESSPDRHTVENKDKIKALKKDSELYRKRVESVKSVAKKLFEQTAEYQQTGGRLLEQVENFKNFKLKTPEEIEQDKANAPKTE